MVVRAHAHLLGECCHRDANLSDKHPKASDDLRFFLGRFLALGVLEEIIRVGNDTEHIGLKEFAEVDLLGGAESPLNARERRLRLRGKETSSS